MNYRVVWPFGAYKRGDDIPANEVTEDDLQFNRVVGYHSSAPPPQPDKATPPPTLSADSDVTTNKPKDLEKTK
jgi:hypothetical protein